MLDNGRLVQVLPLHGHVVGLAKPEAYHPDWSSPWKLKSLPFYPPEGKWMYVAGDNSTLKKLERLLERAGEVVNACDAGRQGELIFWQTLEYLGWAPLDHKCTRLWLSDMSSRGIQNAFAERADLKQKRFYRLKLAAEVQSKADFLLGINMTRYASLLLPAYGSLGKLTYPVGRVKTATLGIVQQRLDEIVGHTPKPYHRLNAEFFTERGPNYVATVLAPEDQTFQRNDELHRDDWYARSVRARIATTTKDWSVFDSVEQKVEHPPEPFNLTELQRTAFRKHGWSPKYTLKLAQQLYQAECITYPRTESSELNHGQRDEILKTHSELWHYLEKIPEYALLAFISQAPSDYFFTETKQEHFAIIPTGIIPRAKDEKGVFSNEYLLWELICRRFVTALHEDAVINASRRILELDDNTGQPIRARLTAAPVHQIGWLQVEEVLGNCGGNGAPLAKRRNQKFPETAETARLATTVIRSAWTKAPEYHNDETLLAAMEDLGLGTAATRAEIMDELQEQGLVDKITYDLRPSGPGTFLLSCLEACGAGELYGHKMAADWESYFASLETPAQKNLASPEDFIALVRDQCVFFGDKLAKSEIVRTPPLLCPKSKKIVKLVPPDPENRRPEPHFAFPGFKDSYCPAIYYGRKMNGDEWANILSAGRKGFGPFEFTSKKGTKFPAYVVYKATERKFEFNFKTKFAKT